MKDALNQESEYTDVHFHVASVCDDLSLTDAMIPEHTPPELSVPAHEKIIPEQFTVKAQESLFSKRLSVVT